MACDALAKIMATNIPVAETRLMVRIIAPHAAGKLDESECDEYKNLVANRGKSTADAEKIVDSFLAAGITRLDKKEVVDFLILAVRSLPFCPSWESIS